MLILVAVTINMAVNGGLFGYAGNAAKDTKTEKQKEEDWTNPGENLSSDELIEFYTSQPKDWVIGWAYKNDAWSNPYFKDKYFISYNTLYSFANITTSGNGIHLATIKSSSSLFALSISLLITASLKAKKSSKL